MFKLTHLTHQLLPPFFFFWWSGSWNQVNTGNVLSVFAVGLLFQMRHSYMFKLGCHGILT